MNNPAQRVIINTAAQYTRTIINIVLSLYSTRLVLDALGKSDYGIFQLVGGVVAMLGFLTNAMVITTQRHLSFAHGQGNLSEVRKVFSNCLLLHLLLGGGLVLLLAALTPWLLHFLEIDPTRVSTAKMVYIITLSTLLLSFVVAPFRALFIARENIVYISCIDVLDGVLKVLFVVFFLNLFPDRLLVYTALMSVLMLLNLLAFSIYGKWRYDEVVLVPRWGDLSKAMMYKIVGFAGWTTYSMGCIISRNQGLAVVLNKVFKNTVINAAYGLAMQVSSSASFVSQSIINAISPQIIRAEGKSERERMLSLSSTASKYAFLLLSIVSVPLIAEMPKVLDFWLGSGRYPLETVFFCRVILIAALCDQLTIGLGVANQAIGKIRNYSLTINTFKLLSLPAIFLCLWLGVRVEIAMWIYVLVELLSALLRLPFLKYTAGLSVSDYLQKVFATSLLPFCSLVLICVLIVSFIDIPYRFVLTLLLSFVVGPLAIWIFACTPSERQSFLTFIRRKKS